ncbi:glycosyl transferase family 1 [Nonlabens tegetincola]|uniref:glycosyl transferase family 1 n=1 Tax=Nonlabens tegetincola TaxID=323273 RepID=UPI000A20A59E|nr:glycosyl transferase family 1 [Nonlabens tegetincola]ARN70690.1 glycosyl transferase family 1 [Nonlabens tegetincola]
MNKSLILVTYYWPPAGGPGVQRWLKFIKYLSHYNYDITVVIPENPDYPVVDSSLNSDVPENISIVKVPIAEPSRWLGKLSRKRTKKLQRGILDKQPSWKEKIALFIRGNFFIPDARIGWKNRVVKELRDRVNDSSIIITTGPPHSVHLVGLELKRMLSQLKWIADFRDPWTTIGYHKSLRLTRTARRKHESLEQKVLDACDHLLVTSEHTKQEFATKTHTPIRVITNGFDRAVNSMTQQPPGAFTMSHIGTLLSDRNPNVLWQVLLELTHENELFKSHFKLVLAGNVSNEILKSIKDYNLDSYLENHGYVKHDVAYSLMKSTQLLLLIEIDSKDTQAIVPGKLFEYLASRRPIIALGPSNAEIKTRVEKAKAGSFFTYDAKQDLKNYILSRFNDYLENKNTGIDATDIEQFHRKNLTHSLNQLINEVWE